MGHEDRTIEELQRQLVERNDRLDKFVAESAEAPSLEVREMISDLKRVIAATERELDELYTQREERQEKRANQADCRRSWLAVAMIAVRSGSNSNDAIFKADQIVKALNDRYPR